MKKRDTAAPAAPIRKTEPARGVLRGALPPGEAGPERYHPSPDLAPFIEHFWAVRWNLEGLPPRRVETLPHPAVHLTFEPGATLLGGVGRGKFSRLLAGSSFVFGVKFLPASFRAFYGRDVSTLTGWTLPAARVFGPSFPALEKAVLGAGSTPERVQLTEAYLRRLRPAPDPEAALVNPLVAAVIHDRSVTRVDQLVARSGLPVRQLQRLFRRYVGVSPKWVIARYRIHEALERVHSGLSGDWATLALDLGYADQAHFIRDFKALVGQTPRAYRAAGRP